MTNERTKVQATALQLDYGYLEACIIGTRPLLVHAMSAETKGALLLGGHKKSTAEKAQTLKHSPIEEFVDSMYVWPNNTRPTRLCFKASAFKGAMKTAALRLPGFKKTEIGQLIQVEGEFTDLYGIPMLRMAIVRAADIKRTPDVRSIAALGDWACRLKIRYVKPNLSDTQVGALLQAAGIVSGVGDGRPEKGILDFGQFAICNEDDPAFKAILLGGGRETQDRAIANPMPFDPETQKLFAWYNEKIKGMGDKIETMARRRRANRPDADGAALNS